MGSLFDAALYIFIFLWTMSLEQRMASPHTAPADTRLPHGVVFALFMGWCMVGALGCELYLGSGKASVGVTAAHLTLFVLLCACVGLAPALNPESPFQNVLNGFCVLEAAFGAFVPAVALLRALHLSSETRSAATALYRVPTNIAVCLVLLYAGSMSERQEVIACFCLLAVAIIANAWFIRLGGGKPRSGTPESVPSPTSAQCSVSVITVDPASDVKMRAHGGAGVCESTV
eukprot:TRINITY_DN25926_c0_g1_i1.p1 TRINITY_DN25926_c0_g1~~TRINITY_DN25926_c0_g1_i1.p1  ORF type:complete len:267 (+),score=48.67 TRINITY_DN25926_c0_g1_i1:110-802(+)